VNVAEGDEPGVREDDICDEGAPRVVLLVLARPLLVLVL
jgi:hypothetical protein